MKLVPLRTARLRLEPVTVAAARRLMAGDLSGLTAAAGWPHEDTADGLAMAVDAGYPPGWFVTADGTVIGDCGTHGPVDAAGRVEIGYGLAESCRGRGYGTEVVAAVTEWLLSLPEVRVIVAHTLTGNAASRRVLEKAGFQLTGYDQDEAVYQRVPAGVSGEVARLTGRPPTSVGDVLARAGDDEP